MDEEEEGREDEGGGRLPRGEGRRRRTGGGDESTVGHFHASSERGKTDGQRWVRRRWRSSQQVRRRGSGGHVVGRKALPHSLPQCTSPSIRGILKGTKVSGPQNEFVMALGREEIASLDLTTDAKADGFLIWIIDQIISYFQNSDFQTHVVRRNAYVKSQKYAHCVHNVLFSST